jgi:hypothetical protein
MTEKRIDSGKTEVRKRKGGGGWGRSGQEINRNLFFLKKPKKKTEKKEGLREDRGKEKKQGV